MGRNAISVGPSDYERSTVELAAGVYRTKLNRIKKIGVTKENVLIASSDCDYHPGL